MNEAFDLARFGDAPVSSGPDDIPRVDVPLLSFVCPYSGDEIQHDRRDDVLKCRYCLAEWSMDGKPKASPALVAVVNRVDRRDRILAEDLGAQVRAAMHVWADQLETEHVTGGFLAIELRKRLEDATDIGVPVVLRAWADELEAAGGAGLHLAIEVRNRVTAAEAD